MRIGRFIAVTLGALVVVAACLLVLAFAGPRAVRARLWRAAHTRAVEPEQARLHLAGLVGGADRLPASLQVLESDVRAGRDSTYYFKVRVAPHDVPAFKDSVCEALRRQDAKGFTDADDRGRLPAPHDAPRWWHPEQLPDGDIVSTPEWRFVFSPATGVVYAAEVEF